MAATSRYSLIAWRQVLFYCASRCRSVGLSVRPSVPQNCLIYFKYRPKGSTTIPRFVAQFRGGFPCCALHRRSSYFAVCHDQLICHEQNSYHDDKLQQLIITSNVEACCTSAGVMWTLAACYRAVVCLLYVVIADHSSSLVLYLSAALYT